MPKKRIQHDREPLISVLSQRLRAARKQCGLTQAQAAKAMSINAEFYGRLERGRALPSIQTLVAIADLLDVSVDHLFGHDDTAVQLALRGTESPGGGSPVCTMWAESELPPDIASVVKRVKDDPELLRFMHLLLKHPALD